MNPNLALSIEIISVVFSLLYVALLAYEHISCWLFGILSSALGIVLFLEVGLYSESILYLFYVAIGIYGWVLWLQKEKTGSAAIKEWTIVTHIYLIIIGIIGSFCLGYFMSSIGAKKPYIDAATTVFSFIASYMQAHKILSNWVFWIVLNAVSVYLYYSRGLEVYGSLMILYTGLSVWGFVEWRKKIYLERNGTLHS